MLVILATGVSIAFLAQASDCSDNCYTYGDEVYCCPAGDNFYACGLWLGPTVIGWCLTE